MVPGNGIYGTYAEESQTANEGMAEAYWPNCEILHGVLTFSYPHITKHLRH